MLLGSLMVGKGRGRDQSERERLGQDGVSEMTAGIAKILDPRRV